MLTASLNTSVTSFVKSSLEVKTISDCHITPEDGRSRFFSKVPGKAHTALSITRGFVALGPDETLEELEEPLVSEAASIATWQKCIIWKW